MPEPLTTVGLGAIAAYLGKDGIQKLLGPTADYLGAGIRDLTKRRAEAIGRIFQNAAGKVEEDGSEKSVPPKVLKEIIEDGSFADQPIEIEYLGGVLASSRSGVPRDNRGASVARLVNSLSNYQLRAHYLLYSSVKHIVKKAPSHLGPEQRSEMKMFIPLTAFLDAMEFQGEELASAQNIITHIFFGLQRNDLIEQQFLFGQADYLQRIAPGAPEAGIVFMPSALGIDTFLWAFGEGDRSLSYLFDPAFNPVAEGVPAGIAGAQLVSNLLVTPPN